MPAKWKETIIEKEGVLVRLLAKRKGTVTQKEGVSILIWAKRKKIVSENTKDQTESLEHKLLKRKTRGDLMNCFVPEKY